MSDLIVLEEVKAIEVFTVEGIDPLIEGIREKARSVAPDMTTKKGRDQVRSLAANIAKSKTAIDNMGKDLTADWAAKKKIVDNSRKKFREEMDALKEEVRAPLTEYEEREKAEEARKQAVYDEIVYLGQKTEDDHVFTLEELEAHKARLDSIIIDESLGKLELDCLKAKKRSTENLNKLIADAQEAKSKQEELERFQREEAERKQREHEERIAREAAEKAKREAEEKALREKQESDKALEAAAQARVAAEREAKEAKERAEREAKEAIERAEREKQAAIKAEKQRQAAEELRIKQEAEAREANKKHKAKIHNEALDCLVEGGISKEDAKEVVKLLAKGMIKNCQINY